MAMEATDGVPRDWRTWRRFQALRLKREGWYQRGIAVALGVSEVSVSHWCTRAAVGGPGALLARPSPGRPPGLSPDQIRMIPELLWHGAEAYGFRGNLLTCARVAKVIEQEFAVCYDKGHVARLLRRLGWMVRQAKSQRRTPVFVDEAGFYLLPSVLRTYAPQALTPVLRAKLTRDHLSVMGGMTPRGRIYTLARQESLNGSHTVEFLVHLLRVAAGRLLVVWDGSPIHRRVLVQDFVSQSKGAVRVEALPGYAPDLNPWDEGGWNHLKNVEMPNLACKDLEELHEQFHLALNRLRHKPWLVHSFFTQAGLVLPKV
jgi:transposase